MFADFIVEFTNMEGQGVEEPPHWSVHTDDSSNKHTGEISVVPRSIKGDEIECMV